MREIVLDTETTGLEPRDGHRIVEIGAVEIVNYMPTGRTYHEYINPERDMPDEAYRIHGLSGDFLADKPLFSEIVDGFLEFIGESKLVIHNASFDMKFINAELEQSGRKALPNGRAVDSLKLAQRRFPGSPNNLDALCKRFNVDLSVRVKHGALLDSELLAEVYLNLMGGRQVGLELDSTRNSQSTAAQKREPRPARQFAIPPADLANHNEFIKGIKDAIWHKIDQGR